MKIKSIRFLVSPLSIGLIILLVAGGFLSYKINERLDRDIFFQPRGEITDTPQKFDLDFETISLTTSDQTKIHAWYIPGTLDAGIVVSPGYKNSMSAMVKYLPFLHDAGYHLLVYCPRGQGESDGKLYAFGSFQSLDVEAGMDFLKSKNIDKIALFGHSNGAVASLIAASQHPDEIFAVVADSPFATLKMASESPDNIDHFMQALFPLYQGMAHMRLGYDLIEKTSALKIIDNVSRVIFIHSEDDSFVTYHNSKLLNERAKEPKELWLAKGAEHVKIFDLSSEEYSKRVLEFLLRMKDTTH